MKSIEKLLCTVKSWVFFSQGKKWKTQSFLTCSYFAGRSKKHLKIVYGAQFVLEFLQQGGKEKLKKKSWMSKLGTQYTFRLHKTKYATIMYMQVVDDIYICIYVIL